MQLSRYKEEVLRTLPVLKSIELDTFHMLFGMLTELGELSDQFKKNLAYGKKIDWVNVEEELGDAMWYIVNFCNLYGLDLESILEQNINKLRARFPEKFTEGDAINRDLKQERKILEGSSQLLQVDAEEIKNL